MFESITVNSSDCSCNQITISGRTGAKCNCCLAKSVINATLLKTPTACNATESSAQQCSCKSTSNSSAVVCDCVQRFGVTQSTRNAVTIDRSQCSCLNQTVGFNNFGDCQCCVPNVPPTQCELLAVPKPSNLRCKCAYIVVNGVSDFKCDCDSTVNSTYKVTRRNLAVQESSCCCVELSDPITRKGYKSCNCTQPSTVQTQSCQCKAIQGARNSTKVNCDCSDCQTVVSKVSVPLGQCKCSAGFYTVANSVSIITKAENTTNTTTTNSTTNSTTSSNSTTNATQTNITTTNMTSSNSTTNATTNSTTNVTSNTSTGSNSTNTTNVTAPVAVVDPHVFECTCDI